MNQDEALTVDGDVFSLGDGLGGKVILRCGISCSGSFRERLGAKQGMDYSKIDITEEKVALPWVLNTGLPPSDVGTETRSPYRP
jgi:hypothetical protein